MVGRKLFKTKLCQLYQKGRCHRQTCSFAHGNADIRRSFTQGNAGHRRSFTGRRDHEGRDLRETLERRRSPVHRYSPVKDHRGRHSSRGGNTPGALSARNDLKHQKKQVDGESDSCRSPNDKKQGTSESIDVLDEQLTELQTEIDMLIGHKRQLELYIQECAKEAAGLTSKIEDLEGLLLKEKEESKRISSKIKKFIKLYSRNSRLQDELKRSYAQLQKQVEMLCSDISGPGTNGEDLGNNISSDKDSPGLAGLIATRVYDEQHKTLSSRKRVRIVQEPNKASNQDNGILGDEIKTTEIRPSKLSEVDVHHAQPDKSKKMKLDDRKNGCRPFISEDSNRRGNNLAKESKISELGLALPSTSMAAHPVDEVEIVDADENVDVVEDDTALCENEVADRVPRLLFLPPPPTILQNTFSQYNDNDESVDIEGIDEETADVDID